MQNKLYNSTIIGTGSYLPEKVYTNEYLESIVDTTSSWIYNNLGIKERHISDSNQSTSDLATLSAQNALKDANLLASDIDLILVATSSPDRLAPSTACIVQDKLKAYNAAAFDISAVCSGFLFAMSTACQFISSGAYENILVIGADTFSKITDWTKRDCVFFGDGAGAVVIQKSEREGFLTHQLFSDGRGKFNFTIPAGGSEIPASKDSIENKLHYFKMNGKNVYKTAIKVLPIAIKKALKDANLDMDSIKFLIPHQPSINILKDTAKIIGLPFSKVMTNMDKYANTSGGTIPILLDEINKDNKINKDDIIMFAAVGSGWTYGASIIKWK
jgi:3-oxoacyl-[acyl-carrier-protein] synthase-3